MNAVKDLFLIVQNMYLTRWFLWVLAGISLILISIIKLSTSIWLDAQTKPVQIAVWVGLLVGLVLIYSIVILVRRFINQHRNLRQRAEAAEHKEEMTNRQLQAVFRLSQKFVVASNEEEIIELVLHLAVEMAEALGASIVPIDEHGQPIVAINYGDLPAPVYDAWVEYLASPAVRQRCGTCQEFVPLDETCPLLENPLSREVDLYCLPLRRGEREFGILNLYLSRGQGLDEVKKTFLRTIADETALAIESIRLRKREIDTLRQLKTVRRGTDLAGLVKNFLEDVRYTLKADIAWLVINLFEEGSKPLTITSGNIPEEDHGFIEDLMHNMIASVEPVLLGEMAEDSMLPSRVHSLIAVPVINPDEIAIGSILCGNLHNQSFNVRHLAILKTVASQIALVVQNSRLMVDLEFRILMAERTRLAREIHDGLGQTLGYLKLQTAQMQNYLAQGEVERLRQSLRTSAEALRDAYEEARTAIDSLRITSLEAGLTRWLEQTVLEFQENSGVNVDLNDVHETDTLAPEIQAQLIRIVQEALSNIRKHSEATQGWVSCYENSGDLVLEVRDNGRGFTPEDVPAPSRHGLQGMRERAELIGADFQIISCPREGTTVKMRLPLMVGDSIS